MSGKPDIGAVFCGAIEFESSEQRRSYLNRACGDDAEFRRRVDRLLQAHFRGGCIIDSPAHAIAPAIDERPLERPGSQIGPYKLLEQIGEGGMGAVFMAEQSQPVRRAVALKVIKAGMDSAQVIARFEAERQALALMDHPNIAKVLDAGTTEAGRPYFVMELVKGVSITTYCDENHVALPARLELFTQVCQAVQHAHQKGVIHRDLKPTNVMVTLYDDKPVPKVIDFGVAKAIGGRLTDRTIFTGYGQIVGTLEYMCPEQARLNALDIDTRGDVYSLGVLLYELLTGATPFDKQRLRETAFDEVLRMIREDEPPKPSTRLSTTKALASIAVNRGMDAARLSGLVRGELDWIVMKALEKDRNRRYETANGLAMDVQRYLNDEPVLACPPSAGYRLRKLIHRNQAAIGAAFTIVAALVLGTAVSMWQAIRAYKAESLAEQRSQSEQRARHEADGQRLQAEANLRCARQAVDEYFTLVSEDVLLELPGLQTLRKKLLVSALKYYENFEKQADDAPQAQVELAGAYYRVGQIYATVGSPDASLAALSKCFDLVERLQNNSDCTPEMWKLLAGVHKEVRPLHNSTRPMTNPTQSLPVYQRAVVLWEKLARDHADVLVFQRDAAGLYAVLGELQAELGRRTESIASLRHSCELLENLIAQDPSLENRAQLAGTYGRLGLQYANVGNRDDTATVRRLAVQLAEGLVNEVPRQPYFANLLGNGYGELGNSLVHTDPTAAQESLQQSLAMYRTLVNDFPNVPAFRERMAVAWFNLANLLIDNERADEAASAYREAVMVMRGVAANTPDNSDCKRRLAKYQYTEGHCWHSIGRHEDASRAYGQALLIRRQLVADFPSVARYQQELAWQLATCPDPALRDPRAAVRSSQQAVELSSQNATCWNTLGVALYRAGDWMGAIEALERSRQLPTFSRNLDWFLAMAYCRTGNHTQARQHYDQAQAWMAQNRPHDEELRCFRAEAAELLKIDDPPKTQAQ